jgi:hypothetical protein
LVKHAYQILVLNILSLFIILFVLRFRQNGGPQRGFDLGFLNMELLQ